MSNYSDHVYEESFNDSILSFDQYVQESALIVGGIITGVVAFIGLIILLIKKFFFSKDSLNGQSWSVSKSLIGIKNLLNGPNVPQKITVQKGIPIDQFEKDPGPATGNLVHDVKRAAQIMNSTRYVLKDLGALIDYIEKNKAGGKDFDPVAAKDLITKGVDKAGMDKLVENAWIDNYTYDTGELRGRINYALKEDKEISDMVTDIDKRYKKLQKDTTVNADVNKVLSVYYQTMVHGFSVSAKMYSELYKQLKTALRNGSD
jgi:hypothetical protein